MFLWLRFGCPYWRLSNLVTQAGHFSPFPAPRQARPAGRTSPGISAERQWGYASCPWSPQGLHPLLPHCHLPPQPVLTLLPGPSPCPRPLCPTPTATSSCRGRGGGSSWSAPHPHPLGSLRTKFPPSSRDCHSGGGQAGPPPTPAPRRRAHRWRSGRDRAAGCGHSSRPSRWPPGSLRTGCPRPLSLATCVTFVTAGRSFSGCVSPPTRRWSPATSTENCV